MTATTEQPKPKHKGGRPRKQVDEKLLRDLSAILCTYEEMSHILGCSTDVLGERYADVIKEARANGKQSLRRLQWKIANKGNASMAIFLGKTMLHQREEDPKDIMNFNINIRRFDDDKKA